MSSFLLTIAFLSFLIVLQVILFGKNGFRLSALALWDVVFLLSRVCLLNSVTKLRFRPMCLC